jgi:hypothetical protein
MQKVNNKLKFSDFVLSEENTSKFSLRFKSFDKSGLFPIPLFLDEYCFEFRIVENKFDSIQVTCDTPPNNDISFLIIISFSFLPKNVQSFQEKISFLQNQSSVLLIFLDSFKQAYMIQIEISDWSYISKISQPIIRSR